jgi:hypothetical protein
MAAERPSYLALLILGRSGLGMGAGAVGRAIIDRRCDRGICQTLCPQFVDSLNTSGAVVFPQAATDIPITLP